jgi:hypothetical protein
MNSVLAVTLLIAMPLVMAMPQLLADEVQGKKTA